LRKKEYGRRSKLELKGKKLKRKRGLKKQKNNLVLGMGVIFY